MLESNSSKKDIVQNPQLGTPPLSTVDSNGRFEQNPDGYFGCPYKEANSFDNYVVSRIVNSDIDYSSLDDAFTKKESDLRPDLKVDTYRRRSSSGDSHESYNSEASSWDSQFISPVEVDNLGTFRPSEKKYSFLVVDDNWINIQILSRILNRIFPNSNVVKMQDSTKVAKKIKSMPFDTVFLDIEMPEVNGVELALQIKNEIKKIDLPLISVTSRTSKSDLKLFKEVGFACTLSKPLNYSLEELQLIIGSVLSYKDVE